MAGDRSKIKGLTVEISGDVTDLTASLKSIDKESAKTSEELRSINQLLKLDPTNTELLAQKQKVLADAIAQSAKKVETLKAAEESAREQLERGEIGQEQFRALQRETIRAESELHKLEQQLDDTEKAVKDLGRQADDTSDDIEDVGDSAEDATEAIEEMGDAAEDTKKQTDQLSDSLDDLKGKLDEAKDSAKDSAADLAKIGATAVAVGTAVIIPAAGKEDALASMQANTGASDSQMVLYENSIDDLFAEGFGEDLDDIATTMSTISQLTKETKSDALTGLTRDAITLRDTFGYETQESMKAAKMMVDQFGISYDSAFNLVAQATQKGLNRSGDLLDIINEYSVHFKGLGFDAESMLSVLEAGSENGAFSLDKIGDATKELGIRLRDTSDTTSDAYARLLLDADEYRQRIAAGGESARLASSEIITSLLMVDDQIAQNEIGVALFGTMWEDLGKDAISSLLSVNGTMDQTKDTMTDIRDIKYSTTSNEWKRLGRTVQTDVITPLGERLLPTAQKFCNFLTKNLDTLIPLIKKIAIIGASIYTGMKLGQMVSAVVKLIQAYKALKTAATTASAAMTSTPWGAIGAAIGLAVGAVVSLVNAEKEAAEAAKAHRAEILAAAEEEAAAYREAAKSALDAASVRRETANAINDEYDKYDKLVSELDDLVDAEGRVIKGNEDRVEFIRNVLSEAIGEEIELVDGQIQKYGELRNTIADTLALKRGEAMASKMESSYNEAKDNLSDTQKNFESANQIAIEYEKATARQLELVLELASMPEASTVSASDYAEYKAQVDGLNRELSQVKAFREENKHALENRDLARTQYDAAVATIAHYENLTEAIYSGSTEQILAATKSAETSMITASQGASYATLFNQALELSQEYTDAVQASKNQGSTYQPEQLADMQTIASTAITEAILAAQAQGAPQYILNRLYSMEEEGKNVANDLVTNVDRITGTNTEKTIDRLGLSIYGSGEKTAEKMSSSFDKGSEVYAAKLISSYDTALAMSANTAAHSIKSAIEASALKNEEGLGKVRQSIIDKPMSTNVSISADAIDSALGRLAAQTGRTALLK